MVIKIARLRLKACTTANCHINNKPKAGSGQGIWAGDLSRTSTGEQSSNGQPAIIIYRAEIIDVSGAVSLGGRLIIGRRIKATRERVLGASLLIFASLCLFPRALLDLGTHVSISQIMRVAIGRVL